MIYVIYRSQPNMSTYIQSITSIPGDVGVPDTRAETKCHRICTCLPKPVVDVLSEMLDMSLLTNGAFMLICLGNILAMIGFYVPYVFLVDRAIMLGIDKTKASFLLSVIGKYSNAFLFVKAYIKMINLELEQKSADHVT